MSPPGKRSDAARNAAAVLAAARALLTESGSATLALDEVARRAGVGNATLYRHFPTREDLLAAVYADEVSALCRHGEDLLAAADPVDGLFTWLDAFVEHAATRRPLALAATEGPAGRRGPRFDAWHAAITATAAALVERAHPHLQPGLTTADILALATGAALTTDPARAPHLVSLLRTGLLRH